MIEWFDLHDGLRWVAGVVLVTSIPVFFGSVRVIYRDRKSRL